MLNSRLSYFIAIKLRHKAFSFVLPIPLFILIDLLYALADLFCFFEYFFPRLKLPGLIVSQFLLLIAELRSLGRWSLAEVADGENQITILFY